jgi:hypothetical protein
MVTIKQLTEHEIYTNFSKLYKLIENAMTVEGSSADDYARLLVNSVLNENVLAVGALDSNGEVKGLAILVAGLSYTKPSLAAYWVLLSFDKDVSFRECYQKMMKDVIEPWMKQKGIKELVGSSPRRGFHRLLPSLDSRWKLVTVLVAEVK